MKKLLFLSICIISVCLSFSSCEDEKIEIVDNDNFCNNSSLSQFEVVEINGKKLEWSFRCVDKGNILSKGIIFDETWLQTKEAYLLSDPSYKYTVIKVNRTSEPGKYFYVMIDNLDVPIDTACWAYNNQESNVALHGRLYTYNTAQLYSKRIVVKLPIVKNGVEIGEFPTPGRLPNMTDICDIIQSPSIGNLPDRGYDLYDELSNNLYNGDFNFYYDAFIAGLQDRNYDKTSGYKSLGGYRDTPYHNAPEKFGGINEAGYFWTSESTPDNSHYPLEIEYKHNGKETYFYSAFVNSACWNKYGFSVRYVFEPVVR